jgi:hypothetical protein
MINKVNIEQDLWSWVTNYIEVNHKFYDYKFPPCPYAKAARLKDLVNVTAWDTGSAIGFIKEQTDKLIVEQKYNVQILVFPAKFKWYYHIRWSINQLNKKIISKDFYAQYGTAIKTKSQYSGLFEGGPYFIVIINKLSDVLKGHQSLNKTNYYAPWADHHYQDVVVRRQKMYDRYKSK